MKAGGIWDILLPIIKAIGCPIAKKQCPKWGFKQEDCDAILNVVCP